MGEGRERSESEGREAGGGAQRCIRTIKQAMRGIVVSYAEDEIAKELDLYVEWYNKHRPHEFLNGCTPDEVYFQRKSKNLSPRWETRVAYPVKSPCANPQAPVRGSPGVKIKLCVSFLEGRKHLPIIKAKKAA